MTANVYITAADLLDSAEVRTLAQLSAASVVTVDATFESDLHSEMTGTPSGNPNAVAAAGVIQAAVDAANSEIDGHLCGRYQLPLTELPDILVLQAVRLTRYELHANKGRVPDGVEHNRASAMRYLDQVASGKIKLKTADDIAAGGLTLGSPASAAPPRTFAGDNQTANDFMGRL